MNETEGKGTSEARATTESKVVSSTAAALPEKASEAIFGSSPVGKQNPAATAGGPYKVGGGVTAPKAESTPDPSYPDAARDAKLEGTVLLWVVITPEGKPGRILISRPFGAGLDDKAVEAVKTWKFKPATLAGRPVAVQVNVEVNFRLY